MCLFAILFQQLGIDEKPWHKRNSFAELKPIPGAKKAPFRGNGGEFNYRGNVRLLHCEIADDFYLYYCQHAPLLLLPIRHST